MAYKMGSEVPFTVTSGLYNVSNRFYGTQQGPGAAPSETGPKLALLTIELMAGMAGYGSAGSAILLIKPSLSPFKLV